MHVFSKLSHPLLILLQQVFNLIVSSVSYIRILLEKQKVLSPPAALSWAVGLWRGSSTGGGCGSDFLELISIRTTIYSPHRAQELTAELTLFVLALHCRIYFCVASRILQALILVPWHR